MKRIINEEPEIHWPFLNVKGKVVLDMGCGKFYSSISTAEWFLNNEAEKVIGVDLGDIGISDERFTMIINRISSTSDIQAFLDVYSPDVIKCDIEGAEIYLDGVLLPSTVQQFAVEYHDATTKKACEKAIKEWKFSNIEYYQLLTEDINRIGVIYAWR